MKNPMLLLAVVAVACAFVLASCTKKSSVDLKDLSPEQLSDRGRSIYVSNCTACHNTDPRKEGSVGPALTGSSKELIEARVLHADYPTGYQPKRSTKVMLALPQLEDEIPALTAYLSSL
jgi:mono/diheme cytochrome c family protein